MVVLAVDYLVITNKDSTQILKELNVWPELAQVKPHLNNENWENRHMQFSETMLPL